MTPWTVARQAPLFIGFPRQEYWSELIFSFSRGSSLPRDRTRIGRWILYHWVTREAHCLWIFFFFFYLQWLTNKDLLYSTRKSAQCYVQPGWEGSLGENGYMCMYGWVPSLFWNITTLFISCAPIQNKNLEKQSKARLGWSEVQTQFSTSGFKLAKGSVHNK